MRVAEDVNGISLTWVHSCLSRKQGIAENWNLIQMYVCKYNFVQVYYIKICKSFLRKKYIFMGTPNSTQKENWILTTPSVLLVLLSLMALCVSIPWEDMIQDYFWNMTFKNKCAMFDRSKQNIVIFIIIHRESKLSLTIIPCIQYSRQVDIKM